MNMVKCPGCRAQLHYDSRLDGKPGICPACQHLILPPDDADGDDAEADVAWFRIFKEQSDPSDKSDGGE